MSKQYTESGSVELGIKHTMFIWNLFFRPESESDFFVSPWGNQELRLRSCFEVTSDRGELSLVIYFHLLESDLPQIPMNDGRLYLYGANNQLNVAQRRVLGRLTKVEDSEMKSFVSNKIICRLRGEGGDPLRDSQKREVEMIEEAIRQLELLETGHFFIFKAESYAYACYERG